MKADGAFVDMYRIHTHISANRVHHYNDLSTQQAKNLCCVVAVLGQRWLNKSADDYICAPSLQVHIGKTRDTIHVLRVPEEHIRPRGM